MVSVGVSSLGYTDLVFIHQGIKIDGLYYRDMGLKDLLSPANCSPSSRTVLQPTLPERLFSWLQQSTQWSGHQTARIWIRWMWSRGLWDLGDFAAANLP